MSLRNLTTLFLCGTVMSLLADLRTVKVSSFGFDPADSTRFLQRAFDSDVDIVVVDRQPTDWISGPLS